MATNETTPDTSKDTGPISINDAVNILTREPPAPADTAIDEDDPHAAANADTDDDLSGRTEDNAQDEAETDGAAEGTEGEEPATRQPAEPSYKVSVDGQEQSIPVSELVKGYQRQATFTKRSMELAESRRAHEADVSAIREERGQYARLLPILKAQAEQGMGQEPDWNALRERDPIEYSVQWSRWSQHRERLAAIRSEADRLEGERRKEAEAALGAHFKRQHDLMLEHIPEYRDAKVRTAEGDKLKAFAVDNYGYTPQEIDQIADYRVVLIFRDAMRYRQLQQGKPAIEKRVNNGTGLSPVPSHRGPPAPAVQVKASRDRFFKSGRLKDAVAYEMARTRSRRADDGDGSGSS